MAQGTLAIFNRFKDDLGEKLHNLETDSFKVALVTLQVGGSPTISAADSDPRWGAGGATNLSTSEVSGTNYTAGGNATANPTYTELAGTAKWDADDPATWIQNAGGPTDIKTAVIYNDTDAGKRAIGFIDMTADGTTAISLVDGDIALAFGSGGIFTLA